MTLGPGICLEITQNLRAALTQCRRQDAPRALWVDSICINQTDVQEKGSQVAMMGRIDKSSRTLICLGDEQEFQEAARHIASLLLDLNRMLQRISQDPTLTWDWNTFPYPMKSEPLLT